MSLPRQSLRAATAALLGGAATGAALTVAEIQGAATLGTPLPPGLWAFLAAVYIAAGALAAGLAQVVLFRGLAPAPAADRALAWMGPLLAAVYAVAIVNQNLLRGAEWSGAHRLLVSVAAVMAVGLGTGGLERTLRRAPCESGPARGAQRLLALAAFLAVLHQGLALVGESGAAPVAAALLLPAASLAATAPLVAALRAAARRGAAVAPLLAVVVAMAVAVSGWRSWQARSAARLRDAPQPAGATHAASPADKPNVLLVVLDTVRAANVSGYGYARRTTPHLDALAAQGVRHAHATTPYGWSLASHASLFTGLWPREHGVGLREAGRAAGVLDPRHVTLAEALAERGYETAGVSANPLISRAFGLDQGFRYFHAGGPSTVHARAHPLLRRVENRVWPEALRRQLRERFRLAFPGAGDVTGEALAWLARPRTRPFFLFVNYMDAHAPRRPRPGYSDRWPPVAAEAPVPAWADREDPGPQLTAGQRQTLLRYYDGALAYVDEQLGRLLRGLDASPAGARTWVIVTSDHGELLGEHGRLGHHCNVYEELLHVPLVMRYPRGAGPAAGTVDEAPIQLADIAPRVLAAAGVPTAGAAPRPTPATLALFECSCGPVHAALHGDAQEAITVEGLKYVEETGRAPRLFDLARDPGEAADLSAARPGDAARLRGELARWRTALRPRHPPVLDPDSAREREEALRALGYIQ